MVAASGRGELAFPMGREPGTIQITFAFPLPPHQEKRLPPWQYFHNPSFPVRRSLNARTMGWEECQEEGTIVRKPQG